MARRSGLYISDDSNEIKLSTDFMRGGNRWVLDVKSPSCLSVQRHCAFSNRIDVFVFKPVIKSDTNSVNIETQSHLRGLWNVVALDSIDYVRVSTLQNKKAPQLNRILSTYKKIYLVRFKSGKIQKFYSYYVYYRGTHKIIARL